ncbi:hypothetical protein [Anaeromyxobacter dehalogenans]|nr:hypothetical protein [Anaeromyxobacter dehalogenans]
MPSVRKILLAAMLFVLGYLTMQATRCDSRPSGAPAAPAAR